MLNADYITYAKLVAVQLLWSGIFIAGQLAVNTQPPLLTASIKCLFSSAFLILLMLATSGKNEKNKVAPVIIAPLFFMALFGVLIYSSLVYIGLSYTTAITASLLIPTIQPIITVILSSFFLQEYVSMLQKLGFFIGLMGALLILFNSLNNTTLDIIGSVILVAAAGSFSIYSVISKSVLKELGSVRVNAYINIVGTVLLFPIAFYFEGFPSFENTSKNFWFSILYITIFAGIIPAIWWSDGIKVFGVTKTGSFTFLMLPFSLFFSFLILNQIPTIYQMLGGFIGMLGVYFSSSISFKRSSTTILD